MIKGVRLKMRARDIPQGSQTIKQRNVRLRASHYVHATRLPAVCFRGYCESVPAVCLQGIVSLSLLFVYRVL